MNPRGPTVVGIDVGGNRKGFHAVALREGRFVDPQIFTNPQALVQWCHGHNPGYIAVDAPCGWSADGTSRRAERELKIDGRIIQSFKTPTRARAVQHTRGFYGWVFNGERLYRELFPHYTLFDGERRSLPTVFETFPHAVVCALFGQVIAAKPKATTRRRALLEQRYDIAGLRNIDFVDAALCAHTAEAFRIGRWSMFGGRDEGFIVVPKSAVARQGG